MKIGPVTVIRTKDFVALKRELNGLNQVKTLVDDVFGNLYNARRALSQATVLADKFKSKEADLDKAREFYNSKYCEYTGVRNTVCNCGNHQRNDNG